VIHFSQSYDCTDPYTSCWVDKDICTDIDHVSGDIGICTDIDHVGGDMDICTDIDHVSRDMDICTDIVHVSGDMDICTDIDHVPYTQGNYRLRSINSLDRWVYIYICSALTQWGSVWY
jgi:hypothetical protein